MIKDKINRNYESGKKYHQPQDMLYPTHNLVEVDGPFEMYNMAIEIPPEEMISVMKIMKKEPFDCADRFSLTGGKIHGEFEMWDGDYTKHLYFCVDFTLPQAIKFANQTNHVIGFVPADIPQMMIGAQQVFTTETMTEFIKMSR